MGQPRTGNRRKLPVVLSSDDEGSSPPLSTPPKPQPRNSEGTTTLESRRPILGSARTFSKKPSSQDNTRLPRPHAPPQRQAEKPKFRSNDKNIQSFFNKTTQAQKEAAEALVESSPEKSLGKSIEEEDLISDDSIDDELGKLADTQTEPSFALALRKRNRGIFEDGIRNTTVSSGSQKFRKVADGLKTRPAVGAPTGKAPVEDLRPWTEKYGPNNLEELAVHKKKVADVRTWLMNAFNGRERKRVLVLKGAAGTGKTTTVSLLANDLGFDINEWKNPTSSDFGDGYVSVASQFEDFLGRSGKFHTLDLGGPVSQSGEQSKEKAGLNKDQIILVEEFPNTFTRSPAALQSFRSIILRYLAANVPSAGVLFSNDSRAKSVIPMVLIVSETSLSAAERSADSFTAHRLLGPELLLHPGVSVIEFNAIAPTFLTKALDTIILKEARKTGRRQAPGPQVIKHLAETGDVRSAISMLEFLCVRGDENDNLWSGRVTFTKRKGGVNKNSPMSKMEEDSLAIITQRESTLGIFHSVGKVVYNKRETVGSPPQPPQHLSQAFRLKAPDVDPNMLFNDMGTDCSTFIAALHENYVLSCIGSDDERTLDSINGCIDALSDTDILSPDRYGSSDRRALHGSGTDNFRQEEISFQLGVRGLLFNLPSPVKRLQIPGAMKSNNILYPTSLKIWRQREEIEGELDLWVSRIQNGPFMLKQDAGLKPGAVETWRRNNTETARATTRDSISINENVAVEEEYVMHLGSGSSARMEMLLERLPFMTIMERHKGRLSTLDSLRELEKVTKFTGIGRQDGNVEEDDEVDEGISLKFPRSKTAGVPKRAGPSSSNSLGDISIHGLVLSDDDIEDD